jgi:hypothetical protein
MLINEAPADELRLAELQRRDRTDWGLPLSPDPTPTQIAMVLDPRPLVKPPEPPVPTPPPPPQPNLYLPEGAFSEEGARLTLIRAELRAFEEPNANSKPSPFTMKEGEKVRPLTRLRNPGDFDWIKFERDGRNWWAQAEYFIRVDPRNWWSVDKRNLDIGQEAVDRDSALPPDYAPDDLAAIPGDFVLDSKDIRLRREAADSLAQMIRAAEKQGRRLRIFSGYRDFETQKKLFLEAMEKHGPKQNGTAAPGYSEHQLGTTIDICNTDPRFVLSSRFGETPEGRWLYENGARFGFHHSYTSENTDEVGYKPEPWHMRYTGITGIAGSKDAIARN